jgi:Methyltransferase domain
VSGPDIAYDGRTHDPQVVRPSWSANPGYLNAGHRSVYGETKDIPGWQMEHDTYKLYEVAHFAGDVILDLGAFGGRSSVVALKGASGNPSRSVRPQVFSLDVEPAAIERSHESLNAFGLERSVLLFLGGIEAFFAAFDVGPTMVFVDADHRYEGVKRDLDVLSRSLAPGIPVLCHDYLNAENDTGEYGVRRAATEWEQAGHVRYLGAFGCSALFVTTEQCRGRTRRLPDEEFERRREECLKTASRRSSGSRMRRALAGLGRRLRRL